MAKSLLMEGVKKRGVEIKECEHVCEQLEDK